VDLNLFEDFKIGDNGLTVSHLQYANDTLCIGKATVDNLWMMKALLRGFEMASGLKINFFKSSLIGVNVPGEFMSMACDFLNCSEGSLLFKYLGLPVGANPKSMSTWEPMVESLCGKLNSWGHKYISFGGRIILLNAVLNSIPIFYLTFLKMPVQVWKRIVRIQREFLWGGVGGGRKVSWVKWKSVCQQKANGGIGIKDIRVMNVSLLAKWKWRLLDGEKALWKDVLEGKYGPCKESLLVGGIASWPRNASVWWKDVVRLEDFGGQGWFNSELKRKVGNGVDTSFWMVNWCGGRSFALKYPRLFSISNQREAMVGDIGVVTEEGLVWNFSWRRRLFVWEEELLLSLMEDLEGITMSNEDDVWRWNLEDNGIFSVKSAYLKLEGLVLLEDLWGEVEKRVFANMWDSPAPSKVVAFAWRVLLNRIPTKGNLAFRNVLPPETSLLCVMCNRKEESALHLFLHCDMAALVWLKLMLWLDCLFLSPPNLFIHWECWSVRGRNKKVKKGLWLIWHTTIWVLWKARNDTIFNGQTFEVDELVEEIKVLSWRWLLHRTHSLSCLFYEWSWNPMFCLGR